MTTIAINKIAIMLITILFLFIMSKFYHIIYIFKKMNIYYMNKTKKRKLNISKL